MAGQVKFLTVFPTKGSAPGEPNCSRTLAKCIVDKMLPHKPGFQASIDNIGKIAKSRSHLYVVVRAYVFGEPEKNFMLKLVDERKQPITLRAFSPNEEAGIVLCAVEEKANEMIEATKKEGGGFSARLYKGEMQPSAADFAKMMGRLVRGKKTGEINNLVAAGSKFVIVEVGLSPTGTLAANEGGLPNLMANAIAQAAEKILNKVQDTVNIVYN